MPREHNVPLHFVEKLLRSATTIAHAQRTRNNESDAIFMPCATMTEREVIKYLCRMAEDATLPMEILERLASHPSSEVREAVSDNPGLSIDSLMRLAHDESIDVRYAIAENHSAPSNVLYELCEDDNPYVSHRATQTLERLRRSCRFTTNRIFNIERRLEIKHSRLQYSV